MRTVASAGSTVAPASSQVVPALDLFPGSSVAPVTHRAAALAVDAVFLLIGLVLLGPLVQILIPSVAAASVATVLLLHWGHAALLEGSGQHGTAGKRLFRLRVLAPDGARPSRRAVVIRRVVNDLVFVLILGLAFVAMLRRQYGVLDPSVFLGTPRDVIVWFGLAVSILIVAFFAALDRNQVLRLPGDRLAGLVLLRLPLLPVPSAPVPSPRVVAPASPEDPTVTEVPMPGSPLAGVPQDASVMDPGDDVDLAAPVREVPPGSAASLDPDELVVALHDGDPRHSPAGASPPGAALDALDVGSFPDVGAPVSPAGDVPPVGVSAPDVDHERHRSRRLGFRSVRRSPSYRA